MPGSRIWPPLGHCLAKGLWEADVSVTYRRGPAPDLPVPLPKALVQRLRALDDQVIMPPQAADSALVPTTVDFPKRVSRGFCQPFSLEHAVNALRLSLWSPTSRAGELAADALRYWYPLDWAARRTSLESAGHQVPSPSTLRRHRIQLDIACMLWHRSRWRDSGNSAFLYLSYDASPQRPGIEVFATVERLVPRVALSEVPCGGLASKVTERRLPLVMLGHSRSSLADKIQAHVHTVSLEYGPSASGVEAANFMVRQVLSDMGTEWGIGSSLSSVRKVLGEAGLFRLASRLATLV